MTFTRLLEIERKWVRPEEENSVYSAERLWREQGCPTEPRLLEDLLERVITTCQRGGIPYASVLLKRKRELGRGDWKPRPVCGNDSTGPIASPHEGDPNCPLCHGSGYTVNLKTFSGSMCECNRWRRNG